MLLSIQALLSAPNPDDPLANDVAEAWKTNEARAIETGTTTNAHIKRKKATLKLTHIMYSGFLKILHGNAKSGNMMLTYQTHDYLTRSEFDQTLSTFDISMRDL